MLGLLLLFNATAMFVCTLLSVYLDDGATEGLLFSSLITTGIGLLLLLITRNRKREIKMRDGYLTVVMGWLSMVIFGTLPYLMTQSLASYSDALFETMSGFTATGATIVQDIEALPKSIILWRSLTHWLGGMGIIVLAVAILPLLGIGGVQLFSAEATAVGGDKLHPRISHTAKRLWYIYVGFTALEALLLALAGMSVFDAINHSMSTMASGGFSTKNESLAYWNNSPMIQYIVTLFMFLAGTNFVLIYFGLKGKLERIWQDNEFRWYVGFVTLFSFAQIPSMYNRTLTVNGVAKAFAMTGWRIGYLGAPEWIAKACTKMQGQITSGANCIAQRATIAALDAPVANIQYMVDEFATRRERILELLSNIEGFILNQPKGAFYVFPDISHYFGKTIKGKTIGNASDFALYLLEEAHVATVTGDAFGCPNNIRISYAASMKNIEEAVARIQQALT